MNSPIQTKSRDFAIRIINCYNYLVEQKREQVMSKQLLRCGTSIGANTRESKNAQSRMDFLNKLNIALKEADDEKQIKLYKQLEENLTRNAASVFLQDMADLVAVRKGLTGLTFYPLYVLDVSTLSWSK